MRPRISIRGSVRPSICMSVNPTSKIPPIHLQSLTNHPWSFLDASSHLWSSTIFISVDLAFIPPTSKTQFFSYQSFCIPFLRLMKVMLMLSVCIHLFISLKDISSFAGWLKPNSISNILSIICHWKCHDTSLRLALQYANFIKALIFSFTKKIWWFRFLPQSNSSSLQILKINL